MTESNVQLNPDGTGQKIRSEKVKTYDADGIASDVQQQVVVLADRFGTFMDDQTQWRDEMLMHTRKISEALDLILEALT